MTSSNHLEILKNKVVPIALNHAARPFFAAVETNAGGNQTIRIHSSRAVSSGADRRDLLARLRDSCGDVGIRIEAHGAKALYEATSLETFARPMKGEILFDPTGSITHARRLVAYAAQLRDEFGLDLKGVFWSGEWRTVYIVFDAERTFVSGKIKVSFLRGAEVAARRLLLETCGPEATDFVAAVRLGFEPPPVPVIAVDRRSDWLTPTLINALRRKLSMSALAAVFGLSTAGVAVAADKAVIKAPPPLGPAPAVSGPNGKIAIMGGWMQDERAFAPNPAISIGGQSFGVVIGEGSYSVPLGHSYGLQLDAAGGWGEDDRNFWGIGAHLFWRDPTRGLLGIVGSHASAKQPAVDIVFFDATTTRREITRLGGEGELYAPNSTLAAIAGYQWADGTTPPAFIAPPSNNDGFFGSLDLTWYSNDNLALSVGAEYSEGPGAFVTAGLEVQAGLTGLSFFAKGAYGEHDQYRALAGLRYYFGAAPKSLKDRHRYDDPQTNLATQSFGGFQTQYFK